MEEDTISVRSLDEKISSYLDEKRIVGIAHTAVMDEMSLDEKKNQLKEINELKDDFQFTKEKFDSILVPDEEEFQKIEELSQEIRDAETSLKAIGLNIKTTNTYEMSGEIFLDHQPKKFNLSSEFKSWTAHQSVKIVIDHLGEIEITSGSQDVQGMKETLEKIKTQYQELIDHYPTSDLSQLTSLMNQKESLKTDLKWLQGQLDKQSKKGEESIFNEILTLENKIKSNWNKIPSGSVYSECEGKDKLRVRAELSGKINQIEDVINQLQKDRQQLSEILENDRKTVKSATDTIVDLKTQLHGNNQRKEEIENRLTRLTEDGLSIEEREHELNRLSVKIEQKERALNVYRDEIEEIEIKPLKALAGLNNRVERLDDEIRNQEISHAGMERELSMLMAQSTDSGVLEEKLAILERKEIKLKTEVTAIKLSGCLI